MSERNKRTPWDEELQAQVLAEEKAKRKKAQDGQLAAYDALSTKEPAKPTSLPPGPDESDIAALLAETETPLPEPKKPTLGIEVGRSTFKDEDAAVTHFERAFAPSNATESLWTRMEDHFGAKELRIYIGTAVLILVVLLFGMWFNGMAARGIKARAAAKQIAESNEAAIQEVTGTTEAPE